MKHVWFFFDKSFHYPLDKNFSKSLIETFYGLYEHLKICDGFLFLKAIMEWVVLTF